MTVFCRCGVCGERAEMNTAPELEGSREPVLWLAFDVTHWPWPATDSRGTERVRICPECAADALDRVVLEH